MSRLRVQALAAMAAVGLLSACASAAANSDRQPAPSTPVDAASTSSVNATAYSLYTHCGINEALVGTTFFVADKPLNDGQGNPPAGWDNPYQLGTINLPSPSVAVFRDSRGHVVRFHARIGATSFLQICS